MGLFASGESNNDHVDNLAYLRGLQFGNALAEGGDIALDKWFGRCYKGGPGGTGEMTESREHALWKGGGTNSEGKYWKRPQMDVEATLDVRGGEVQRET